MHSLWQTFNSICFTLLQQYTSGLITCKHNEMNNKVTKLKNSNLVSTVS